MRGITSPRSGALSPPRHARRGPSCPHRPERTALQLGGSGWRLTWQQLVVIRTLRTPTPRRVLGSTARRGPRVAWHPRTAAAVSWHGHPEACYPAPRDGRGDLESGSGSRPDECSSAPRGTAGGDPHTGQRRHWLGGSAYPDQCFSAPRDRGRGGERGDRGRPAECFSAPRVCSGGSRDMRGQGYETGAGGHPDECLPAPRNGCRGRKGQPY